MRKYHPLYGIPLRMYQKLHNSIMGQILERKKQKKVRARLEKNLTHGVRAQAKFNKL